ncbi:Vesicular integral-membrane protein VIP36-like [Oopsacas minuta]|uniref:Vesicular integral-membrane protein VIP36-like n=1 Tax=Oopsacas minuta TaxID=111878 RepID=A0AAV7JM94_9METZ|nr:Vesicular integral-membrane protein VIP36-like [Oopsacas minuta]
MKMLCFVFIILSLFYSQVLTERETEMKDFPTFFRKEHSLVRPYQGRGMQVANWDYTGTTLITNDFVRLTPDRQGRRGSIWNIIPVTYKDWEVHIQIHIHGSGRTLFGDGLAFWYTKEKSQEGGLFGSKDYFSGVGIFFDTFQNNVYSNQEFPYISASVFNGSSKYDSHLDGRDSMLAGCHCKLRGKDSVIFSISYIADQLALSYDLDGSDNWKMCFYQQDISLPTGYFFGVSSATGDLADNHDVISIKSYEVDATSLNIETPSIPADEIVPSAKQNRNRPKFNTSETLFSSRTYKIFTFLALFLLIIAIGTALALCFEEPPINFKPDLIIEKADYIMVIRVLHSFGADSKAIYNKPKYKLTPKMEEELKKVRKFNGWNGVSELSERIIRC